MLIFTQDKTCLVDSDKIVVINTIEGDREIRAWVAYFDDTNTNGIHLGKYATKERAKEVLQELADRLATGSLENYMQDIDNGDVAKLVRSMRLYEMPEK